MVVEDIVLKQDWIDVHIGLGWDGNSHREMRHTEI